jgi:hypothetical protein
MGIFYPIELEYISLKMNYFIREYKLGFCLYFAGLISRISQSLTEEVNVSLHIFITSSLNSYCSLSSRPAK